LRMDFKTFSFMSSEISSTRTLFFTNVSWQVAEIHERTKEQR
jgi:hypothetical protein